MIWQQNKQSETVVIRDVVRGLRYSLLSKLGNLRELEYRFDPHEALK